ncbi:MAG: protein translocase subunit SecF [Candidatus Aminicenantes bacterium]|nr:protein translocase subunit SecF [Candidatus Aminicenantes bacterium]
MRYKLLAFGLSGFFIVIGLLNMTVGKKLTPGIDFAGGALVQIRFIAPISIADLRQSLNVPELESVKIQEVEDEEREYIIRAMLPEDVAEQELETHAIMAERIVELLKSDQDRQAKQSGLIDINSADISEIIRLLEPSFPDEAANIANSIFATKKDDTQKGIFVSFDQLPIESISPEAVKLLEEKTFLGSLSVKRRETVGPQVGSDLRRRATQATVWALIGMLIYIGIRFKFAFGIAAILTLAHDVIITMGIFSFTNREINLPVIAAILTIVGYSLNDTIVIFDRVRDNIKLLRKNELSQILDASINQTLSRTVITSGTTLLTVVALFIFGGPVINDFAFTMMIGVVIGTYSSIYQSCSILFYWNKIFKPKKGFGK